MFSTCIVRRPVWLSYIRSVGEMCYEISMSESRYGVSVDKDEFHCEFSEDKRSQVGEMNYELSMSESHYGNKDELHYEVYDDERS